MILKIKRQVDVALAVWIGNITAFLMLSNLACVAAERVTLDSRPNMILNRDAIDRLRGQAAEIGWGGLFYNHTMSHASSAYMMDPWLGVTATPFLSTTFFLESRAWAVKHRASRKEADVRFSETYRDPDVEMVFSFIFISETRERLEEPELGVVFESQAGRAQTFEMLEYEVSTEHAMGGKLYAARGRLSVPIPRGHDWNTTKDFSLTVRPVGGDAYRLEWQFP